MVYFQTEYTQRTKYELDVVIVLKGLPFHKINEELTVYNKAVSVKCFN